MRTRERKKARVRNDRLRRVDKAVDALRHGDDYEREKAVEYLSSRPTKRTVEKVLPLLDEKDTPSRMAAVEVIKKTGHGNIEAVAKLLTHNNEDIRAYGCEILGSLKIAATIPHLISLLSDKSENVKNAAVIALGEFDDETAVEALLKMLGEDEWIAFSAICSLGKTLHTSSVEPLFVIFQNRGEELSLAACEVLMEFGDDAILDRMFTVLKGWGKEKRHRYVEVVIQQGNENLFLRLKRTMGQDLFEHLLRYVNHRKSPSIPILKLLTHFRSVQACEVLLDNLKEIDPEDGEYDEVIGLLVSLSRVWKHNVGEYLKRGEEYVCAIIKACGLARVMVPEDLLVEVFSSSSEKVRREIIRNAPLISLGKGYNLLRAAVRDKDGHVQSYAVEAIAAMNLTELEEEIVALARAGYPDVRVNAVKTLLKLHRDRTGELFAHLVHDGSSEDKMVYLAVARDISADDNFPFIEKLFRDKNGDIRKAVIGVIGEFLHDKRYGRLFQELLKEDNIPHEVLKLVKEKKLIQFRDILHDIFADSTKSLWTRYYALLALGAFKEKSSFGLFVKGLGDENSLIKIGSLKALKDLGDGRALAYVRPLTQHKDEDVRSTAEFVMHRLGDC